MTYALKKMKAIHHIYAVLVLALVSCTSSDIEPEQPEWPEGKVPLSLRASAPTPTRTDLKAHDNTDYDIYTCAVYHHAEWEYDDYYSYDLKDKDVFRRMAYDAGHHLYFMPGYFYPFEGQIDLLSFGVPDGKRRKMTPKALPEVLSDNNTAEYMMLHLGDEYDGSFEVIAADRQNIVCTTTLKAEDLPYAHFHFIQASIRIQFRWGNGVAADAAILDRLKINSVQIENTPFRGDFYLAQDVADGEWRDTGDDVLMTKGGAPQAIPYGSVMDWGNIYVVPQASRQRFIISYTIQNGSGTDDRDKRTMNYVVQDLTSGGWKAGHGYTYIINIGYSGTFNINNVSVKPFAEGNRGTTIID